MSMEHKAFLFDYEAFKAELKPVVERALANNRTDELEEFALKNFHSLVDPYEGDPLSHEWAASLENGDVDEYADYCLTKYYLPRQDIGLGPSWALVQSVLESCVSGAGSAVLGTPIVVNGSYFDPGKMGSYFSSLDELKERLPLVQRAVQYSNNDADVERLSALYLQAIQAGKGLYTTF